MSPPFFCAIFSAVLYLLSFSPWSFHFPTFCHLQWFSFVPFLCSIHSKDISNRGLISSTFLISFCISLGGFYWISYAAQEFAGFGFLASIGTLLIFCLIGQIQIPLYFFLRKKALLVIPLKKWVFMSGLIYAGIESFLPKLFKDTAGYAFADSLVISQLADLGGVFFITVLVITFAELFVYSLFENLKFMVFPISIILFSLFYGNFRIYQIDDVLKQKNGNPSLKVSIVQANIGNHLKIVSEGNAPNVSSEVINRYLSFSNIALLEPSDLIVWPETAYPLFFNIHQPVEIQNLQKRIIDFSYDKKVSMIFGGYDKDEKGKIYNSVYFLSPFKNLNHDQYLIYHKQMLLMFAETLPLYSSLPGLRELFPKIQFFGQGSGPAIFSVNNSKGKVFKLAPSICYEGLFHEVTSRGSTLGADVLINFANDSWFGPSGEPYLHLALIKFRTIETRLPMIRATNTGFSAFIDELGRIKIRTNLFEATTITSEIKQGLKIKSPYQYMSELFGYNWLEFLLQSLVLILILLLLRLSFKMPTV